MQQQLAKLIPLLAIAIATPVFAAPSYFDGNAHQQRIADGEIGQRKYSQLNLTTDQKSKIERLRAATRSQIEVVLTPEQRQKYAQIQTQRQANRQGRQQLKLSADQKAQFQAIRTANKAQFRAILTPEQQAQIDRGGGRWRKGGSMARLNLTPAQKTKMKELRTSARSQMATVLTSEQQQQAKANYERRQTLRDTWNNLNLTADQQLKIRTIRQASRQQLEAILTPAQQAQRKSHHRHGYRNNSV
jgi:Spy/CpxP family protein refolding chaperone